MYKRQINGTTGSCECTSCDTGYSGASCQTAGACTASADSAKDGTDGKFYCINGTIGGTTGSCECSCAAGYEGTNCDTDTDECKENDGKGACQNGATCTQTTDGSTLALDVYHCACLDGFVGTDCDVPFRVPSHCHQFDCDSYGGHNGDILIPTGTAQSELVRLCCNYATRAAFDAVCDDTTDRETHFHLGCCHRENCI